VNSIDFLMLMGIFLLIFVSTYESSLMYYLRIVIRFVLISFFINLIFSRFRRNMKYISFLIVYLFVVFVFKSMVQ
jgi:hypothetical protein